MKNPMENAKVDEMYGVIKIGENSKAYKIGDMNKIPPPIANDIIGTTPVLVTWCPLCGSFNAYKRKMDGKVLNFNVEGVRKLEDNGVDNLHIKDEETKSVWTQVTGFAVEGPKKGKSLETLPIQLLNREVVKKLEIDVWKP
ncbi:MAG TPA: DUF3179 domain-containing (seleno)protein [Candidatus Nanoarchaeia archaeon]|nr:DUF3179 domain-containing (seleno)protein [Candidatus Nanoarchaeia archaeon]